MQHFDCAPDPTAQAELTRRLLQLWTVSQLHSHGPGAELSTAMSRASVTPLQGEQRQSEQLQGLAQSASTFGYQVPAALPNARRTHCITCLAPVH